MNSKSHLNSLMEKHQRLDTALNVEQKRPHPNQSQISRLKKEKLKIKEKIASFDLEHI